MKATCPKCGRALRVWEWKQECPQCGVNMIGYDLQARLLRDADQAEAEFAAVQPYIDRAKASYIGSKAAIARIVCHVLPFGTLFLPLCRLDGRRMQIVDVVQQIISLVEEEQLPGLLQTLSRPALISLGAALGCTVLCVLFVLVHLGFLAGSCSKKGRRRLFTVDALMLLTAAAAVAGLCGLCAAMPESVAALAPGIGEFVLFASFAGLTAYDAVLARVGIPVQYTQCYIAGIPAEEFLQQKKRSSRIFVG